MPVYEFRCQGCGRKVSLFVRSISSPLSPQCPQCGGTELERLISGFAYHRSQQSWLEQAGPPQAMGGSDYYSDPRNVGRWAEHRLKEMGMDMRSEEYWNTFSEVREMIDAAREGEMPEPLKDL
ncbi:MAG: zinc ribbon domain-containing protein [Chloroflexota bacterium]|nr:zinc ribbon domain-containing protein [Chloroflexota bacterium]